MNKIIDALLSRQRAILFLFGFILLAGTFSFIGIPKESTPDVKIPIIYTNVTLTGVSAEDAEVLLLKPLELQLKNVSGIKSMKSTAYEGGAHVVLEFRAGLDSDRALRDVRVNVDKAKVNFPINTKDPTVDEVNMSLFPILLIKVSGNMSERTLYKIGEDLRDAIESRVSSVLKANLVGIRDEVIDILVDPEKVESYHLLSEAVFGFFARNNALVSAGTLNMDSSAFAMKVPGLFKTAQDVLNTPFIGAENATVKVSDIAEIRKTYKTPKNISRDRGKPTIALEISKRTGENVIETIEKVKAVVEEKRLTWPKDVEVAYAQDGSHRVKDLLKDLRNELTSTVVLVMLVILGSLGIRSSLLVGLAVPGSFLAAILVLNLMGYTMNIVVLFSLILSVGMLVDGAIVVVEYADRHLSSGASKFEAFCEGSKMMAKPVISSTATIIVAFLPLLFWPGVVGQFMKYLPITLIATLTASILMGLIFIPVLGILFGGAPRHDDSVQAHLEELSQHDIQTMRGFTGFYVRLLEKCLLAPKRPVLVATAIVVGVFVAYGFLGKGTVFFPDIEPDDAVILVHGRGNMSMSEKDILVRRVEDRIKDMPEFASVYTRVGAQEGDASADTIGTIMLEFVPWDQRRKAVEILKEAEERTKDLPGIHVETQSAKKGPSQGKPIVIEVSSADPSQLLDSLERIRKAMESLPGVVDVEDDRPLPGIQWEITVDRSEAAKYGADVSSAGAAIQLITEGVILGTYRPDDATDAIDIRLRFPEPKRTLEQLKTVSIETKQGQIPISQFIKYEAKPAVGSIKRVFSKRTYTIKADAAPGALVDAQVQEIKKVLSQVTLPSSIYVEFKGENEDQQETADFLGKAFGIALFMISLILVTQFNSFFKTFLILSAVVMSTAGVLVGLVVTNQPFGVVMGGIGLIALSGIIVSNNIIFLDTYGHHREALGHKTSLKEIMHIILLTGAQRLRPVILTKLTIVLGLLPIMLSINISYIDRVVTIGAPSSQWWTLLATTIVFGVLFASPLTLIVTPSALMLQERCSEWWRGNGFFGFLKVAKTTLAQWNGKKIKNS